MQVFCHVYTEEWTTQTAIYCDTFWLQSFGKSNSSLSNAKKYHGVTVALFYFEFDGNFRGAIERSDDILRYKLGEGGGGGEGGLYLEGFIIEIL